VALALDVARPRLFFCSPPDPCGGQEIVWSEVSPLAVPPLDTSSPYEVGVFHTSLSRPKSGFFSGRPILFDSRKVLLSVPL